MHVPSLLKINFFKISSVEIKAIEIISYNINSDSLLPFSYFANE